MRVVKRWRNGWLVLNNQSVGDEVEKRRKMKDRKKKKKNNEVEQEKPKREKQKRKFTKKEKEEETIKNSKEDVFSKDIPQVKLKIKKSFSIRMTTGSAQVN